MQEVALGDVPSPSSPSFTPLLILHAPHPLPLRSMAPLNQLGGLGERCNLPQRGPGQSPGRKRICTPCFAIVVVSCYSLLIMLIFRLA